MIKKKFSFKGLKKVGPIRLVNGFRSSKLRPKIALDEQKDVADDVRQWLYERRNKYEKFVDRVLGRASPITTKKTSETLKESEVVKKDETIIASDESKAVTEQVVTVIKASVLSPAQRDDCDDDDSCDDDYDSCDDDDSCEDEDDEDDCDDDSCEDDDDDDDDCESELAPGEGEAVWEEQQVQGGIEIVEECPEEESDDCEESDSCESEESNDYEYESGIEETVEVVDGDDECDDDSCDEETSCEDDDSCDDAATEDCDDDDDECKKRKKQSHDKKKKKKTSGQKKKKKKTSGSKKSDDKQKDKKKAVEKKRIRYPPVQKVRNQYARALQNVTDTPKAGTRIGGGSGGSGGSSSSNSGSSTSGSTSSSSGGGGGGGIGMGIQNAVLNKVDSLLAIKEQGLFNRGGNSDTNTGCSIVEGWSCPLPRGKYAHPIDCQKYVMCQRSGIFSREITNSVYECEDDEAYDPKQRSCTTDWSSCEALEQCLYNRQLVEDPSDETSYFICIRDSNKLKESYSMYRRSCTQDRVFDPDYQLCIDCDDSEKLSKAKKKRAQIKKQKECKKKKAQKKKKKDKKKSQKKSKNQAHKTSQKKN